MGSRSRTCDIVMRCAGPGESLGQALESVQWGVAGELVSIDVRAAADALGEITGAITTDEILDRIFSEFCIGK